MNLPAFLKKNARFLVFLLKIGIMVLIFYWVLKDSGSFASHLLHADPCWLIPAFLCLALQALLSFLRWGMLLRGLGVKLSFRDLTSLGMLGMFFSLVIPGGAVGGDLIKAGILAGRSPEGKKFHGVFSIITDRIIGMMALFSFTLVFSLLFLERIRALRSDLRYLVFFLMILSAGGLCAGAGMWMHEILFRPRFMRRLLEWGDAIGKNVFSNTIEALQLYRENWGVPLRAFALSFFLMVPLLILALFFSVKATEGATTVSSSPSSSAAASEVPGAEFSNCILASTLSNTASAIPLTPGGLGTRDYVSKEMLLSGGASEPNATAATLLFSAISILISLSGAFFFLSGTGLRKTCRKRT